MNKDDIKQIIFEEIEAAISEMASPEELAADSRPEDEDFSLEDEMEMARDFNDEQDAIFGKPNFVEEEGLEEMARTSNVFKLSQEASMKDVLQFMQRVNDVLKTYKSPGQKRPKKRFTPEEMKALATAMLNPEGFTSKDVIASTSYNSPAQANKFLKALEMKGLITLTSQLKKSMTPDRDPNAPETRGRKRKGAEFDMADDPTGMDFGDFEDLDLSDPLAERVVMNPRFFDGVRIGDRPESETERNNRLDQEKRKKEIEALKKDNAAKAAARAKASAEEKAKRDAIVKMGAKVKDKFGNEFVVAHLNSPFSVRVRDPKTKRFVQKTPRKLGDIGVGLDQGGIDYPDKWQYGTSFQHDELTLTENNNTMSELEKYIKQQIKEAKNPLAKKMKEIETQGRIAALETKLAAVAEMIEETEGRLTRIDEDNEFKEMMDKNAVKEVRKQLKELERAQGKLQKEYDKLSSGRKQEKIVDEADADKLRDLADRQDALDQEVDDSVEEVSFKLNESTLRMQKLAGLITESDIKKKLNLNEEATPEQVKATESLTNALLNASHAKSAIHMASNNTPYVKYNKSRAIEEFDLGVIGFKIDEKYFTNPKMAFVLYRQNLDKLKDLPKRNIKSGRGADSRIEASKQVYNKELASIEAAAKKLEATLK